VSEDTHRMTVTEVCFLGIRTRRSVVVHPLPLIHPVP